MLFKIAFIHNYIVVVLIIDNTRINFEVTRVFIFMRM